MPRVTVTEEVDADRLAAFLAPRSDFVDESSAVRDGDRIRFGMTLGPFTHYERTLEVTDLGDGRHRLTQTTEFGIAIGWWWALFSWPVRTTFKRPGGSTPWWAPPETLDTQAAASLASLAFLSLIAGYVGTLITQTLTFAADEFDASDQVQGDTFAAVRIGVLLAMVVATWADRHGRRRAMLWCAAIGVGVNAVGAAAPNIVVLGASQVVARGLATALGLLIVIVAAEEMPAGSRAYAVSLLTMSGALGAGQVLLLLPLADVAEPAWRIIYAVPLLYLPLIGMIARLLPESRRFVRQHARARFAGHGKRLSLLAFSSFFLAMFGSPASQLQNEFLREDFGFSAAAITLFTVLTVTPGSIGIVVGGRLADQRGKRLIGGIGLATGTIFTVGQFVTSSTLVLWLCSLTGSILGGLAVPALAVYGPELFPTALRGKANVIITTLGVTGSVVGLVAVGRLAQMWELGPAIATMGFAPAIVVLLLIPRYPETAHRELEELNPEDAVIPPILGA